MRLLPKTPKNEVLGASEPGKYIKNESQKAYVGQNWSQTDFAVVSVNKTTKLKLFLDLFLRYFPVSAATKTSFFQLSGEFYFDVNKIIIIIQKKSPGG